MNYFRFEIPADANGTRITYSLGWHGTMPKCPKGVEVLLYNDRDGYGIAQTKDNFKPKEVTFIREEEALGALTEFMDTEDEEIYIGDRVLSVRDVGVLDGR